MASGSRDSPPIGMEDDELKADGKKRRFKPLEAMRRLFGKGKRKSKEDAVSVVAVKAKSTTALHHSQGTDDEDDGGFKSRQPRPLGGTRSISEDSVFSPETRDPSLQALKTSAVSEESLPKSAFQAELFSKLNKRRSQYSDDDDGLPHSPTPPVTTADIIMGGPLKPLPGAGKSTSRESDNSLISMDGSENDEDDPFKSQWKSSVASKVSRNPKKTGEAEGPINFEKMEHAAILKSDIARDKISVTRARKATRQSRKKREGQSPHSLPSLNEESPTKPLGGGSEKNLVSASALDDVKMAAVRTSEKSRPLSMASGQPPPPKHSSPARPRPLSTDLSATVPRSVPAEEPARVEARTFSLKLDSPAALTDTTSKIITPKDTAPKASPKDTGSKISPKETGSKISPKDSAFKSSLKDSSSKVSPDARKQDMVSEAAVTKTVEFVKKTEIAGGEDWNKKTDVMSSSSPMTGLAASSMSAMSRSEPSVAFLHRESASSPSSSSSSNSKPDSSGVRSDLTTSSVRVSVGQGGLMSSSLPAASTASRITFSEPLPPSPPSPSLASSSSSPESRREGLRATDASTPATFSPKGDDYRQRRQSRSKTLPEQPVGKEEQFSTKVQRAASHRVEATSSQSASPEVSPRHRDQAQTTHSKEPEWFALARRKTGTEGKGEGGTASTTKETAVPSAGKEIDLPNAGPVSSASSALRGETTSKTDAASLQASAPEAKKTDAAPAPRKAETTTAAVPKKVQVTSASKNESVTIKDSDSVGVASSSVGGASSSVGGASSSVAVGGASSSVGGASSPVAGLASPGRHLRGGSVKTSPTKTSSLASRGGSVKVTSSRIEPSAIFTSSSSSVKTPTPIPAPASKMEEVKEEGKVSAVVETVKDVPKWKTQSAKGSSIFTSSSSSSSTPSAVSSSRFSSVKATSVSSSSSSSSANSSKPEPKPASPVKTSSPSKASPGEEKAAVPAWRANLKPSADIKIELIESSSSTVPPPADKKDEAAKKQDSPNKTSVGSKDLPSDQCRGSAPGGRTSKVMNLLKNFENMQGVS